MIVGEEVDVVRVHAQPRHAELATPPMHAARPPATGLARRNANRATRCSGADEPRSCGAAPPRPSASSAASARARARSRSRPSRRWPRRCRTTGPRRCRWWPATASPAPSCRWRRAAARTGARTLDLNACSLLPVARSSWSKCWTMCTSSATARTTTSGGSMLASTLYSKPKAKRPSVQMTLTRMATISRQVLRQRAEHGVDQPPNVSSRIGGVRFWCSSA